MSSDPIVRVECRTILVPLSRPIHLGSTRIDAREFALVELETVSGERGFALGLTRGAPLARMIHQVFAPLLAGRSTNELERILFEFWEMGRWFGRRGLAARAVSLIDIALWDLRGHQERVPLFRLLGGHRRSFPVVVPVGYRPEDCSFASALRADFDECCRAGVSVVKWMVAPHDWPTVAPLLSDLRKEWGENRMMGVDLLGATTDAAAAVNHQDLIAFDTFRKASFRCGRDK